MNATQVGSRVSLTSPLSMLRMLRGSRRQSFRIDRRRAARCRCSAVTGSTALPSRSYRIAPSAAQATRLGPRARKDRDLDLERGMRHGISAGGDLVPNVDLHRQATAFDAHPLE